MTQEEAPQAAVAHPVPAGVGEGESTVRRSRFVARVGRARNRNQALRFVQDAKERLPGAAHYCWAFNAGPPGSTAQVGASDAGEPPGTAGRAMLAYLLRSGVGEVVAVCARYYGGVKLGTGGLARAYSDSAKQALAACPKKTNVERVTVRVAVPYASVDRMERLWAKLDATVLEREFGALVRYKVDVPREQRLRMEEEVAGVTAGTGRVDEHGA